MDNTGKSRGSHDFDERRLMRYWLTASHLKSTARCRMEVTGGTPLIVGRSHADACVRPKLSIDFDPMLSRNHFEAVLEGDRLRVRRLENKHPIYLRGQPCEDFCIEVGQHFTSGQTAFELSLLESSLGEPTRSSTMLVDISRLREMDADRCLKALLDLQPLLSKSMEAPALLAAALPILAQIVPMASGILVVSVQGDQFLTVASQGSEQLSPSRTLLRQAVTTDESVCYYWDQRQGVPLATMVADVRWAVASPIRCGGEQAFVLYAVGSESHFTPTTSGRTPGDLDRAVLTFVAGVLGQHLLGRWSARQFEEERRQRYLAETLREVVEALTSTLEPAHILRCLQDHLQKLVGFDSARVFQHDYPGELAGLREPLQLVAGDTRLDGLSLAQSSQVLCLPLHLRGQLNGVILLVRQNSFRPEEQSLAVSLCAQASVALDNARMFKTVERLATIDDLTQVNNRRNFFRLAEAMQGQAAQAGSALSVVLLDIDHFKLFNDNHGHQVGDQVLHAVASRAEGFFALFGRYGGEEFAAAERCSESEARQKAEQLRQAIEKLHLKEAGQVTVSLGLAHCQGGQTSLQTLLAQADEALYEAKRNGRNQVCRFGQQL